MTDAPAAYLTTVDLSALCRNLAERYGGAWDYHRAIQWLVQGDSPFLLTKQYGVFRSAENPATWLEADEITSVRPTEADPRAFRKLGQSAAKAIRSPYKRRHKVA